MMRRLPKLPPGSVLLRGCIYFSIFSFGLLPTFGAPKAYSADPLVLTSPDGGIHVSIQMPAPNSAETPRWSVTFRGNRILTRCGLGLQTADAGELMAGVRFVRKRDRSVDQRIPVVFGKSDYANDRYHESRFTLETPGRKRID